jgi:hypothetical protein
MTKKRKRNNAVFYLQTQKKTRKRGKRRRDNALHLQIPLAQRGR